MKKIYHGCPGVDRDYFLRRPPMQPRRPRPFSQTQTLSASVIDRPLLGTAAKTVMLKYRDHAVWVRRTTVLAEKRGRRVSVMYEIRDSWRMRWIAEDFAGVARASETVANVPA
jgi:hypothetical protein